MTDRDADDTGDQAPPAGPNAGREDLEDRLTELETTLEELRDQLRDEQGGTLRPPRLTELLRFTEQYTIPTLIALLETTIRSLELLQGTLRLADPERRLTEAGDQTRGSSAGAGRLASVRADAETQLVSSLSELREALAEANLPEESASRSILQDARDLTAEIESQLERSTESAGQEPPSGMEPTESADVATGDTARHDGAVHIDVHDPTASGESRRESSETVDGDGPVAGEPADVATETGPEEGAEPERAPVDVDAELESIKRELGEEEGTEADDKNGDSEVIGDSDADEDGDGDADSTEGADDEGADEAVSES